MAVTYIKTTWIGNELITANDLNRFENGISDAATAINALETAVNGKLNTAGGAMTGLLTLQNGLKVQGLETYDIDLESAQNNNFRIDLNSNKLRIADTVNNNTWTFDSSSGTTGGTFTTKTLVLTNPLAPAYGGTGQATLANSAYALTNAVASGSTIAGTEEVALKDGATMKRVALSLLRPPSSSISITTGQWSGSGPYTYSASVTNVTASTLIEASMDDSIQYLTADLTITSGEGTLTFTTSSKPTGTIKVTVFYPGIYGNVETQVLADVYSKSQIDAMFPVPVAKGGTGLTTNPSMLVNLESTSAASVLTASPRPGVTGVLGRANGGTGSSTFRLYDGTLGTSVNLDTYQEEFIGYSDGATSTPNSESGITGSSFSGGIITISNSARNRFVQIAVGIGGTYINFRGYDNNGWHPWKSVPGLNYKDLDINFGAVTNTGIGKRIASTHWDTPVTRNYIRGIYIHKFTNGGDCYPAIYLNDSNSIYLGIYSATTATQLTINPITVRVFYEVTG